MVDTDTVPQAVPGGQFALEQRFPIDPPPPKRPISAPLVVRETMSAARLVEAGLQAGRPVGVRQIRLRSSGLDRIPSPRLP